MKKILLFVLINLFYSTIEQVTFPRFNCYKSFSKPTLFFKLFIHTYSGPEYIIVVFNYDVKYGDPVKTFTKPAKQFHFKKIDGLCTEENIIFTDLGAKDPKLTIKISIFFPNWDTPMSFIHYTFENEYKSDEYLLIDENGNFAISALVTSSTNEFFHYVVSNQNEADSYFRSIKSSNNHICIVTENNREVVIKPVWKNDIPPDDYIINVFARMHYPQYGDYYEHIHYCAYQCTVPDSYDKQTIFVTEENTDVYFYAIFEKFTPEGKRIPEIINFKIKNLNIQTFHPYLYKPINTNIVFLMKKKSKLTECSDGTLVKEYKSRKNETYYAKKHISVEVMPNVKIHQWIECLRLNPCKI